MNNTPHLLKLSNQALLDTKLKRNPPSVSSSQEDISISPSNTSPAFVRDGLLQHSLHQSTRASSYDSLIESTFTDTDSSFDSPSSDESMSCDELLSTSGSSTTGRVGSITIRSKKRRKDSREQRKSLMQHMHKARCRKEKLHTGVDRLLANFMSMYSHIIHIIITMSELKKGRLFIHSLIPTKVLFIGDQIIKS